MLVILLQPRRLFRYTILTSLANSNHHLSKKRPQMQLLKLLSAKRRAYSSRSPGYCINTVLGKAGGARLWLHHLNSDLEIDQETMKEKL